MLSIDQNPDKDAEASLRAKDEMAEEDEVSSELAEIIGSLVTFHPQLFLNAFAELAPICGKLVQPTMSPAEVSKKLLTRLIHLAVLPRHCARWISAGIETLAISPYAT